MTLQLNEVDFFLFLPYQLEGDYVHREVNQETLKQRAVYLESLYIDATF